MYFIHNYSECVASLVGWLSSRKSKIAWLCGFDSYRFEKEKRKKVALKNLKLTQKNISAYKDSSGWYDSRTVTICKKKFRV